MTKLKSTYWRVTGVYNSVKCLQIYSLNTLYLPYFFKSMSYVANDSYAMCCVYEYGTCTIES